MSQAFFSFEQSILDSEQADRDAKAAAKAAAKAEREAAEQKEELEKSARRRERAAASKRRNTNQWAVCGISCYCRNAFTACYWEHCHRCGQPLHYFDTLDQAQADAKAKNRDCKRL
jgi:hypothetical protein